MPNEEDFDESNAIAIDNQLSKLEVKSLRSNATGSKSQTPKTAPELEPQGRSQYPKINFNSDEIESRKQNFQLGF